MGRTVAALVAVALMAGCSHTLTTEDGRYYRITASTAGTYETTGSARPNGRPCSWVRSTSPVGPEIARGDVGPDEHARVSVREGEYFASFGCQPWRSV